MTSENESRPKGRSLREPLSIEACPRAGLGSVAVMLGLGALTLFVLGLMAWLGHSDSPLQERRGLAHDVAEPTPRTPAPVSALGPAPTAQERSPAPGPKAGTPPTARADDPPFDPRFDRGGRGSVRGRVVVDGDGALPARVQLVLGPAEYLTGKQRAATRSLVLESSQGELEFSFEDLPLAGYSLQASAQNMNSTRKDFLLVSGSPHRELEIELIRAGFVDGTVIDSEGTPVADLSATLESERTSLRETVFTDAAGRYLFRSVLDGEYTIYFGPPDSPLIPPTSLSFKAPAMNFPVRSIPASASLEIKTFDRDGRPLSGVRVRGYGKNGGSVDLITDIEGLGLARFLPPGRFRLSASTDDGRRANATVEVSSVGSPEVQFRLR